MISEVNIRVQVELFWIQLDGDEDLNSYEKNSSGFFVSFGNLWNRPTPYL
jgi:hypothetical protein